MMPIPVQKQNFSERLVRKGVLIEETYRCLAVWNSAVSVKENINIIRKRNPVGAANAAWLREIAVTISSRFAYGESVASLARLAREGLTLETWKYCYLWHLGSTDGLLFAFMRDFLFSRTRAGTAIFTTEDVIPWVRELEATGTFEVFLSEYGRRRMARDLLRAATAFGFLRGSARREVCHPVLPEDAILYALYSMWEKQQSVERLLSSERWRMFLMSQSDVEHELLNLHQFRRLQYARAGSVAELHLPYPTLVDYAESISS